MKHTILQKYLSGSIKSGKEAAELLSLHEKSFYRLVTQYKRYGESCLVAKKPGPKKGSPDNRTPLWIEEKVNDLAIRNTHLGPLPLSQKLASSYLEAFNTLIPIIREDTFHERQDDFELVTGILQQYMTLFQKTYNGSCQILS